MERFLQEHTWPIREKLYSLPRRMLFFFFLNLGAAKPNTEFNKLNNLTSSYYCEGKRYETEV